LPQTVALANSFLDVNVPADWLLPGMFLQTGCCLDCIKLIKSQSLAHSSLVRVHLLALAAHRVDHCVTAQTMPAMNDTLTRLCWKVAKLQHVTFI